MGGNGDAGKPIWAAEVGWNALPSDFPGFPTFGRVDEERQAEYALQAYKRAQLEWPWMGVMSYWFFKRADEREKEQPFYYFRMVDPDFTPHSVYWAMKGLGHSPPIVGLGYKQEDHWAFEYAGVWETKEEARASSSTYRMSGSPGARLTFTFWGTDLSLVVAEGRQSGVLEVIVDGRSRGRYDLRSPASRYQIEIPVVRGLTDGEHGVEIRAAGGGPIALDGIIIRRTSMHMVRRDLGLATGGGLLLVMGYSLWARLRRPR